MMTTSAVFAGMLFAMSLGVGASEPEKISFEEEILVTATARESEELDLPYSTYVLTGDDLRRRQMARTVPEALAEVPGVMVQATSQGQGSPYLRGFTGFRTLFLIDGIRLNNSVFREGPNQYWTTVDPLGLEQLEVVQGLGSVLHGSDAVGGTVQGLTLAPGAPLAEQDLAGSVFYRYASAEQSQGRHVAVRGRLGERWSLALRGGAKSFGDVRAGGPTGVQPRTGYGEWDGDLKAVRETAGGGRLLLAHQRVEIDDAWRTHSTDAARGFRGTAVGTDRERSLDQRRALSYVQYHGSGGSRRAFRTTSSRRTSSASAGTARASSRASTSGRSGSGPAGRRRAGAPGPGAWGSSRTGTRWTLRPSSSTPPARCCGGRSRGRSAMTRTTTSGGCTSRTRRAGPRLSTVLGARWTGARASADRVRDPASGRTIRVEGDWHKAVGNARVPTGRTLGTEVEVTKRNAGDGFVHGVELHGEAGLGAGWHLAGSWAWLEGEVEIAEPGAGLRRQTLDKMMPAMGRLSLRWQPPARRWQAEILWEAAAEQDRLSPGDRADTQRIPPGGTPGWEVLTLRGSWELMDRLSLSGAAENLLDEDYRIHGSGLNRPGRNLVLGLEIGF